MLDLKAVTHQDFAACLEQTFVAGGEDTGAVELRLVEARDRSDLGAAGQARAPFCLLFVGPPDTMLAQGMHPLRHPGLGAMELFLVPVGRDESGVRYEAVFN